MYQFKDTDFLWHEKLADGLWRITEDWGGPQKICMYVVEGENQTAVIDTGCGATPALRKYIEENITNKQPMIAYMSHSHPDHIGGCTMFDEAWIHPEEVPQLAWNLNDKRRVHDAAAFAFTGLPGGKIHADLDRAMAIWDYCKERYIPVNWKTVGFKYVTDGDVIDLGNKKLECIYMNAHGSMLYYLRDQDILLAGDNFTYTLAVGDIDDDVIAKFEGLANKLTDKTMIYTGHLYYHENQRPQELNAQILRQVVQAMRDIVNGVGFENDAKQEMFIVPGAPTLMGYQPDPDDKEGWESYHNQHPERKGKTPKQGEKYVRMVGPVILTYTR